MPGAAMIQLSTENTEKTREYFRVFRAFRGLLKFNENNSYASNPDQGTR